MLGIVGGLHYGGAQKLYLFFNEFLLILKVI